MMLKVKVCISHEKKIDFMSRVVEAALRRDYSHIFVVRDDTMYHSVPGGISSQSYSEYKKTHEIIGEKVVMLECSLKTFYNHFEFYKGLEYSYFQFLGYVPFLGRLFKNGRRRAWCSEYVSWLLSDLGNRWEFADGDVSTPKLFEKI